MTAYFLLVSMSVVIVMAGATYLLSANRLEAMAITRFEVIAEYKEQEIQSFITGQVETVTQIAALEELRQAGLLLAEQQADTPEYQSAYLNLANTLFNSTYRGSWAVMATDLIDILLLDVTTGRVFFSTNPTDENSNRKNVGYFHSGRQETHVQPVYPSPDTGKPTLTVAAPLLDMEGDPYAVLAAHIRLPILVEIVSRRTGLGSTGQSYLVDSRHQLIAEAPFTNIDETGEVRSLGIDSAVAGTAGAGLYQSYTGEPVIGSYRWLPNLQLALLTEISVSEALAPATRLGWSLVSLGMLAVLLLAIGIYLITRTITRPILAISSTAHEIALGNLTLHAPVLTRDETGALASNFNEMIDRLNETLSALSDEKQKSEQLLLNILPAPIAERLKQGEGTIADSFANVTIMFADIVNFTPLASTLSPTQLVRYLNEIFTEFDEICEIRGLEKIKTIGDAYMVVAGLPTVRDNHAEVVADMALDMLAVIVDFNHRHHMDLKLRIGINSGPVVAGVIGAKKFIYDIWGDAVNIASRMESMGLSGRIHVSDETYKYLQHDYTFEDRGLIRVRGKGEMHTYLMTGKRPRALVSA
ncbi:adenylate/guanylate cyclase domain-containing protein [Marinobacterium rhizophilum]|uniref:adenylate/guanylate cyclase domain-containing protein n=1 Tax=Marinobacterium rhizophilum TaxID=420402 RepID=UPI00036C78B1|nr:adenylate/guanylate cyclase domain-containing protein [Marinobacterium rhizophilum]